jgi:hypothetical protein
LTAICGCVVKVAPEAVPAEARVTESDVASPTTIVTDVVDEIVEPLTVALTVPVPVVEPGDSEAV